MRRRRFLRHGVIAGVTVSIAGCNTKTGTPDGESDTSTPGADETPEDTATSAEQTPSEGEQQPSEDSEPAARYFFEDETGALGHLADDEVPQNYDHSITNSATESEYREMQRNDRQYPEGLEDGQLTMTVDEMISRAEEIYNNPEENIDTLGYEDLNFAEEDDEIVFTRALIKASQEAGVASSGLANIVVANIAEDAVDQIQPGFTDFKLSTLPATEPIAPGRQGHSGGVRENDFNQSFGNSGFRHMAALLQYEKDGETELKYAEQTNSVNVNTFRRVIRDPEFSLYRSSLEQDTVDNARDSEPGDEGTMFPEHYVTALDYTKARELESSDDNILGFGENKSGTLLAVGDEIDAVLMQLVDDMGVTGYNNNEDLDLESARPDWGGTVVSDEFGESLEGYITSPTNKERQYLENIGRGLFQIRNQVGMNASIALTGTLEDPEILPTDQETVNAVRQDQAYDQVRKRVLA
ncbi:MULTISPECIES: hypothetical protein [Halolamina]|uniref:Uncharacterized protein n=1 Tax=Halolamina pelagica TaxID=699431 RepID=A0A1I5SIT2_9EURY|nr:MULTISPECIES: hypothetical protein [Halolamina]NHX37039.1 hypothetical protein [Halolamina sp. R1-12]SFP70680.1 hypothetical protein SAMN05216277_106139 [Halolamina pelagica]